MKKFIFKLTTKIKWMRKTVSRPPAGPEVCLEGLDRGRGSEAGAFLNEHSFLSSSREVDIKYARGAPLCKVSSSCANSGHGNAASPRRLVRGKGSNALGNSQQPQRFALKFFSAGDKSGRSAACCLNAPTANHLPLYFSLPSTQINRRITKRQL